MERSGEQKGRGNYRQIHLRVPPEEFEIIKKCSDRRGMSIYKYARMSLITFSSADNQNHDN